MTLVDINEAAPGIVPGSPVVVNLHSPREKLWGILLRIDSSGVSLRGTELDSFDDWLRMISRGEPNIGFNSLFLPMWRVERVLLDESIDDLRSLADRFSERVGMTVEQYFQSTRK